MICPKCKTINYLDPYSFWNFEGNTKCAGCDTIYHIRKRNGQLVKMEEGSGEVDQLPGFAETPDFKPIEGPGKTSPSPRARPDVLCRPKPITRNIRGNKVSGAPLKPEDLVGSVARFIIEG